MIIRFIYKDKHIVSFGNMLSNPFKVGDLINTDLFQLDINDERYKLFHSRELLIVKKRIDISIDEAYQNNSDNISIEFYCEIIDK
jgi:hypothetical protein